MKSEIHKNLDALIAERKRMVAQDLIADAWDRGLESGVEPEILADAFILSSIEALTSKRGAGSADQLLAKYSRMRDEGRLPGTWMLQ